MTTRSGLPFDVPLDCPHEASHTVAPMKIMPSHDLSPIIFSLSDKYLSGEYNKVGIAREILFASLDITEMRLRRYVAWCFQLWRLKG